jgi:5-methylcytosine-specific restriction endonuclease McrA
LKEVTYPPWDYKPFSLSGPDGRVSKEMLGARDGWHCCLCGYLMEPVPRFRWDPEQASFEHVIPVSLGGQNTLENLRLSHLRCNMGRRCKPFVSVPAWSD